MVSLNVTPKFSPGKRSCKLKLEFGCLVKEDGLEIPPWKLIDCERGMEYDFLKDESLGIAVAILVRTLKKRFLVFVFHYSTKSSCDFAVKDQL